MTIINGAQTIAAAGGYQLTWDGKLVYSDLSGDAYGGAFTWDFSPVFVPHAPSVFEAARRAAQRTWSPASRTFMVAIDNVAAAPDVYAPAPVLRPALPAPVLRALSASVNPLVTPAAAADSWVPATMAVARYVATRSLSMAVVPPLTANTWPAPFQAPIRSAISPRVLSAAINPPSGSAATPDVWAPSTSAQIPRQPVVRQSSAAIVPPLVEPAVSADSYVAPVLRQQFSAAPPRVASSAINPLGAPDAFPLSNSILRAALAAVPRSSGSASRAFVPAIPDTFPAAWVPAVVAPPQRREEPTKAVSRAIFVGSDSPQVAAWAPILYSVQLAAQIRMMGRNPASRIFGVGSPADPSAFVLTGPFDPGDPGGQSGDAGRIAGLGGAFGGQSSDRPRLAGVGGGPGGQT